MGITIHYRGTVDDLGKIEELEDRVIDTVFSLGGRATIWRSHADHDPTRMVRGLMIEMSPGQDSLSLLLSPEGHLIPLFQIEEAEKAPLPEPPYCFVKTQFGSIQGHIAIVHLLDAIGQRFCGNLNVVDEGEYFETRNLPALKQKRELIDGAISSLAESLNEFPLSNEAAEDDQIVASRIERVAKLVHQKILGDWRDAEHSESNSDNQDELEWQEKTLEDEVLWMDQQRRKNDLRSERMSRRIAEATAAGMTVDEAFELALHEEGLDSPDQREIEADNDESSSEAWRESLPNHSFVEADADHEIEASEQQLPHPAILQAQRFLYDVTSIESTDQLAESFLSAGGRAAGDIVGGLVQATCCDLSTRIDRALAITQLKRALSGHAFARGAIFGLSSANATSKESSDQLHQLLAEILESIHELMAAAWNEDG